MILFVDFHSCLWLNFQRNTTAELISIHGIHTSMILIHSVPIVQLTFICFNHIDKERKRFLFNNWNSLKMSHHALKKMRNFNNLTRNTQ